MNLVQQFYMLSLVALTFWCWRDQQFVLACLWANAVATLGVLLGVDLGGVSRDTATVTMMAIDAATGAVLVSMPGVARVISALYVVTVPLYGANLILDWNIDRIFALVIYPAAMAQLGAVAIGFGNGGSGGRNLRRYPVRVDSVALSRGHGNLSAGTLARDSHGNAQVDGRLNE